MQISSNKYNIRIPTPLSQAASVLSDIAMPKEDKSTANPKGAAIGNGNSLNLAASSLQSLLAASALDKSATSSQFNYSGPNAAAVTATNERAIASGLSGGYDGDEILTDEDKAIAGYGPNDPSSNNAANAIADARYRGRLTGDITADFLSNLQNYYDLSDAVIQGMQSRLNSAANNATT